MNRIELSAKRILKGWFSLVGDVALTTVTEPLADHRNKTIFFELSRISATMIADELREVVWKPFSYTSCDTPRKARSAKGWFSLVGDGRS